MANATARPRLYWQYDNLFFSGMAVVALITVLVGFARTYFLAGLFRAPLPNLLVHIHGAAFTLWIILFITQISLVAARRVDLHRRLGLLGFVLAVVMIVLGTVTASDRLARHVAQPGVDTIEEVRAFYSVPLADMLMFSTFVYFGYRNRFRPAVHKRLMLFATLSLLDAGFDRWPVFDPYSVPVVHLICFTPLLVNKTKLFNTLALQKKTGEYTILQTFSIARGVKLETSSAQRQDNPSSSPGTLPDTRSTANEKPTTFQNGSVGRCRPGGDCSGGNAKHPAWRAGARQ